MILPHQVALELVPKDHSWSATETIQVASNVANTFLVWVKEQEMEVSKNGGTMWYH